jgi:L-threonylcarbamoyladenylate synthase
VVVYPTETFYGLAADPTQADAVAAIFDLKGRPAALALPLIAASVSQVEQFVGPMDDVNRRLAEAFWPGPLSLVFDAPQSLADAVHAGTRTVAVRVPGHSVAQALAAMYGCPLTATSANRSGEPPPTEPSGLMALAGDPRVLLVDGGRTPGGAPSTIVDARATPIRIVRHGAVPAERVLRSIHE